MSATTIPYGQVLIRDGYPSFSEEEIGRRHAALRKAMAEQGVNCAMLYGTGRFNSDLTYLSNWPGGREGYVLVPTEHDPALLVQLFNHVPVAEKLSLIKDTRWAGPDSLITVAGWLKKSGLENARIGLIGPLPFSQYERLKTLLPGAQFTDMTRTFREIRVVYSEEELRFFRVAGDLTDRSIERLERELRPGLREYELPKIVETPYLEVGGQSGIHFMASTSMKQPTTFVPHQYQSDRVLQPGDVVITEISGSFWNYTGQIHRSFFLGEPTPEWVRMHDVAVRAYEAIEGVLRDGATVDQLLDAAEVIDREGYTIFDDLLHGANQYPPILQTRSTDRGYPRQFTIRENMVITIQPQLTTPERTFGLQFGETVRVTKEGVEQLHHYPRKMVICAA